MTFLQSLSTSSLSDDCLSDLNFEWLFDPERLDHLPMEEQLRLYKRRNLRPGKLYRCAAKIWGAPASRVRWIDCPSFFSDKHRPITDRETLIENKQGEGHEYFDLDYSVRSLQPTNRSSVRPLQVTNQNTSFLSNEEIASKVHQEKISSLRAWLEERGKLRDGLESLGLNNENWLRDKPGKTGMERRVLSKLIAEKHPCEEEQPVISTGSSEESQIGTRQVSALKRPSPEAVKIIERLLYERQMRLIDLFMTVDKDKNWRLTRDEFRRAVHACALPLEDAHIDELISVFAHSPTNELDYRDMALSMHLWKQEKIETKRKKLHSASLVVQTDDVKRLTDTDKINNSIHAATREEEEARARSSRVITRRVHSTSGGAWSLRAGGRDMGSSKGQLSAVSSDDRQIKSAVQRATKSKRTTNQEIQKSQLNELRPAMDAVRTGEKAIDDHCSPSTIEGSTGDAVNQFRREILAEYLEIGRLCSDNGVPFSVPVLQKALLYHADKQRDQIMHELRQSSNSQRVEKTRKDYRPKARLAPITQSTNNSHGTDRSLLPPVSIVLPPHSDESAAHHAEGAGTPMEDEGFRGGLSNNVRSKDSKDLSLIDASRIAMSYRDGYNIASKKTGQNWSAPVVGTGRYRSPRLEGVEPKVDCWMSFEEYSKFRSGEEQTRRRHARAAVSPGRSGNILDKMRLWMPNKDDAGNALFQRISRPAPRYQCYGGGLAAWQINQSGYIQYGTIEK